MKIPVRAAIFGALLLRGCHAPRHEAPIHVPVGVVWSDRMFPSHALGRNVTYRVIQPKVFTPGEPVRFLYLLHGNGGGYREWSRESPIAQLALKNFVLVMPEGDSTYFLNAVWPKSDRYEDFVAQDLVADAERNFSHVSRDRRAIAGVSMGGYAALVLALHHPDEYSYAAALSPPIDAAERAFSWRRWSQSMGFRRIFGAAGSPNHAANDPFVLIRRADVASLPYFYLTVGKDEPLREPVERFDRALTARNIPHSFAEQPGAHNWSQWLLQMPGFLAAIDSKHPSLR